MGRSIVLSAVDPRPQTTMLGQAGGLGDSGPVAMETRPRYPGMPEHQCSLVSSATGAS